MNVRFIDTCILTNILNVPGKNEDHENILKEFKQAIKNEEELILPLATIIETGNHIAQSKGADGNLKRKLANDLSEFIKKGLNFEAPWQYYGKELNQSSMNCLCEEFPDWAMMSSGMGDLSIVKAYEQYKKDTPGIGRIMIWSLDKHLSAYNEVHKPNQRRKSR